jgi:hypothetical protein
LSSRRRCRRRRCRRPARGHDRDEDVADSVDEFEERGRALLGHHQPAVAQPGQQALAGVGERFELAEREEAAGALDRVDGAEDALQQRVGVRLPFERDKIAIELIEILVTLYEKLVHDLLELVHLLSSAHGRLGVSAPAVETDEFSIG